LEDQEVPRQRRVQAGPSTGAPAVVFIAGSGRSGSTLLERALGEMPGFVNVGELIDLFRREASRAERCGCGRPFADCTFWAGVGERAFGGWADPRLADVHPLQRRVAQQRYLPRLLVMPLAGRRFRADVARYGACYASVYRAIAAEAGTACVVDASKWPVQALALYRGGIDVRVIHLVRDVRGVAHSLTKRAKRPPATAARWVSYQGQAGLLRRCGLPFARVRYEDFVRQPRGTVETALTELGLSYRPADLDHLGEGSVTLSPSHGIHGNPSRSSSGEITLRTDEAWRERMSRPNRIIVTAIGLPVLLRYGWRPRWGRRDRGRA
jgi:Sulfotransferase family